MKRRADLPVGMAQQRTTALWLLLWLWLPLLAQQPGWEKCSPYVRRIAWQTPTTGEHRRSGSQREALLTAFVRVNEDGGEVLKSHGCYEHARFGNISIASVPLRALPVLAADSRVSRIEASQSCHVQMDTTALCVQAMPVYEGKNLPHPYTGKGVVMGVQDIGFDLGHPTFYDNDQTTYRIKAFWDQLALPHELAAGRDFTTETAILDYAHSRDGIDQCHGTHTLGIAAGSGAGSPYRGIAWESDICLVANATTEDAELIDSLDQYRYTTAMDALGFKYIFDYAEQAGKPCVISFSEGAPQSFDGSDQLYYAVIDSLLGPGRILVASAGNAGARKTYFRKTAAETTAGTFLTSQTETAWFQMLADGTFDIRTVVYAEQPDTVVWQVSAAALSDSLSVADTLQLSYGTYVFLLATYPSSYGNGQVACEMLIKAPGPLGRDIPLSVELIGSGTDVAFFAGQGDLVEHPLNPSLCAGEPTHSIHVPGSAPRVVCVGATSYRRGIVNADGTWLQYDWGSEGERAPYSSVGPTVDGRTKPDVMAPGTHVVSALNSYYLEAYPQGYSSVWAVDRFPFRGRTYGWTANQGTSMSAPVVGGAIALWLQACPTLTPEQVLEIIARTSHPVKGLQGEVPDNMQGYGEIDVYAGLVEVLKLQAAGLHDLLASHPAAVNLSVGNKMLSATFDHPATSQVRLTLYTTDGRQTDSATVPAGATAMQHQLSHLAPGIYAARFTSADASCCGSFLFAIPQ